MAASPPPAQGAEAAPPMPKVLPTPLLRTAVDSIMLPSTAATPPDENLEVCAVARRGRVSFFKLHDIHSFASLPTTDTHNT